MSATSIASCPKNSSAAAWRGCSSASSICARSDFEAARNALGDACALEIAFVDQAQHARLDTALATAREIATRSAPGSRLLARALHVEGLALLKNSQPIAALDVLLQAAQAYEALHDRAARAQVLDTLGMVESSTGQIEDAVHYYALSLVNKTLLGDRHGIAITLGNLGRLHLGTGAWPTRSPASSATWKSPSRSATSAESRGCTKIWGVLTWSWEKPPEPSNCCGVRSRWRWPPGFRPCSSMLTRTWHSCSANNSVSPKPTRRWRRPLICSRSLSGQQFRTLLAAARGEILAARRDPAAVGLLHEAVAGFASCDSPEEEIAAQRGAGRRPAWPTGRSPKRRVACSALAIAHGKGLRRYLPLLGETLAGLGLVEGMADDTGRQISSGPGALGDNYVLIKPLGRGAYGEVFQVYDPRRGKQFALKRLLLSGIYDPRLRRRWSPRRASSSTSLRGSSTKGSRSVVALGNEPGGGLFILQDFIPGVSLRTLIDAKRLPDVGTVLTCLANVAHALEVLHDAGVLHRDLKPDNIILRDDGRPVLIDFGVARIMDAKSEILSVGTLDYGAAEQLAGEKIDGRADLYSLGVVAFEWLCGLRPLNGHAGTPAERSREIAAQRTPSALRFRRDLDPEIDELLLAMLAPKPNKRPATAREVAQRCERLAARATF